jgi:hypothetical protein
MLNHKAIHQRLAFLSQQLGPPSAALLPDPDPDLLPEVDDDEDEDDEPEPYTYDDHRQAMQKIEARTAVANSRLAEAKADLAEAVAVAAYVANLPQPAVQPTLAAPLCRHVMPSGRRCRAVRHNQTIYCFFHDKHRHRVRNRATLPPAFNLSHLPLLEDRASLQVALDETLRGFIDGTINDRKTGLLLYGLQIAFQNVRSLDKDMISEDSLSTTTDDNADTDLPIAPLTEDEQQFVAESQADSVLPIDTEAMPSTSDNASSENASLESLALESSLPPPANLSD